MSARPWVRAAAALSIAILAAAGCQTHPATPPPPISSAASDRAAAAGPSFDTPDRSAEPSAPDSAAALPDALSRKTAAYARSMDSGAQRPADAGSPSSVQWGTPRAVGSAPVRSAPPQRLAANAPAELPAPQPSTPAISQPHTAAAGGSPAVAALAHSASTGALSDVPAIVPESADETGSARPASAAIAAPDSVESQVSQRIKQDPHDVAAQLDNQLLLMMKDQPAPQLAGMPSLASEDQELVNTLVDGLTNFRTSVRQDENMLLASKIRPLLDMADRLRAQAELSVPTAVLCSKVSGFGQYTPINPPRFPAGRENPVLVYCEIENFASHHNNQDQWETNLSQQVTLFTEIGMFVWKDSLHEVNDLCNNRRHDFFLFDYVRLPPNLTIGRYVLKVTVIDRSANRVAEKTVPLEIDADPTAPAPVAPAAPAGNPPPAGPQAPAPAPTNPPAATLLDGQ